ncbi:type IV toxin-antitoxin system AbiEi family antitoxin domain-containing protein [Streptomyces tirandamycinicus]
MTVTLDDASATPLAASDGGPLTVEQGLALGCSRATLYRRLKACGWQQVT